MSNEPNIRNRVAGAVVLVSLAVIFLPLILDGKKKNQILDSYIPEKPKSGEIILVNVDESLKAETADENNELSPKQAAADKNESLTIDVDEITESATTDKPEAENPTSKPVAKLKPPEPEPERNNRPNYSRSSYLVQMGSFSSQTNAQALVQKMRSANHRAYFKAGRSAGKTIYRVFSGPYAKKDQADKALIKLKSLANVSPIVVTYDPLKHAQG